jgi:uncharacterized protein (TIGR02284 family)
MEQNRIIDQLDNLTESFILIEELFRQAIEKVESAELRNLLEEEKMKHGLIVRELQAEVEHLGGTPKSQGTVAGSVPDLWLSFDKLLDTDDKTILALLEENEDSLLANFRQIIDELLPIELQEFLRQRYVQIINSHDLIRNLRDSGKYKVKMA